ncbi:hypothetical protein [Vibrio sp. D431a]|uniref:hypothetical protein n=1 Tax=Vibrio sp. D431a TaxID=2837388 RepID=UPI00255412FB|nr:hypothetical protein [Vibrio sp. D431a]MDK9789845.1 hypothetical protein [Vibrio sp. D431a]
MMSIEEFADALKNLPTPTSAKLSEEMLTIAKEGGFVVISGVKDDLLYMNGAVVSETDVYSGEKIYFDSKGFLPTDDECECEELEAERLERLGSAHLINAEYDQDGFIWKLGTEVKHINLVVESKAGYKAQNIILDISDL